MLAAFAEDLAREPDPILLADFDYDPGSWPVSRGNPDDYNPYVFKNVSNPVLNDAAQTPELSKREGRHITTSFPLRKKILLGAVITGVTTIIMFGAEVIPEPEQPRQQPTCHYARIEPMPTTPRDPADIFMQAKGQQLEQQLRQLPRYECQTPTTR